MWREVQLRWHGAPRGVSAMSEVLDCCASTLRGAKCKPMQSPSGFLIGMYMSIASLAEEWVLEHCTRKCSGCRWVTIYSIRQLLRKSTRGKFRNIIADTSGKIRGASKSKIYSESFVSVVSFLSLISLLF